MDKITFWKKLKTSDVKRYGLKMSKLDTVMSYVYFVLMLGGIVGYFISAGEIEPLLVAIIGLMFYLTTLVTKMYKRIRELGGDIFYPKENKELK